MVVVAMVIAIVVLPIHLILREIVVALVVRGLFLDATLALLLGCASINRVIE